MSSNELVYKTRAIVTIAKFQRAVEQSLETDNVFFFGIEDHLKEVLIHGYRKTLTEIKVLKSLDKDIEQLRNETDITFYTRMVLFSLIEQIWKNMLFSFNNLEVYEQRDSDLNKYSYYKEWKKIEYYFIKSEIARILSFIDIKLNLNNILASEIRPYFEARHMFTFPAFGQIHDDYNANLVGIMDSEEIKALIEKELKDE